MADGRESAVSYSLVQDDAALLGFRVGSRQSPWIPLPRRAWSDFGGLGQGKEVS